MFMLLTHVKNKGSYKIAPTEGTKVCSSVICHRIES